jgi:hypothetical protein
MGITGTRWGLYCQGFGGGGKAFHASKGPCVSASVLVPCTGSEIPYETLMRGHRGQSCKKSLNTDE